MSKNIKETIEHILTDTKRDGIENLLKHMEEINFYDCPCSTMYHLAEKGGLAKHSLSVYETALNISMNLISQDIQEKFWENMVIVTLLHDIGKCGQFGKSNYIPNMIKDGKPNKADPEQKYKQSKAKPYITNAELFTVPHEIRSISIIDRFIDLTEEEYFAILYHNGMYGDLKYQLKGNETELYMILHFADMWASRVIEKGGE